MEAGRHRVRAVGWAFDKFHTHFLAAPVHFLARRSTSWDRGTQLQKSQAHKPQSPKTMRQAFPQENVT